MRKLALFFAGALLCSIQLLAQNTTISGKVSDSKDGSPLTDVTVTASGTNVGVKTDLEGNFSITFPSTAKSLTFSYVGYLPVTRAVGKLLTLDVQLTSTQSNLDEVVVTGFGTQRKRDVTTSIATIGGDKIKNVPVQSFEQALSGKAAGVNVTMPNGVLGNPPIVRVRGVNTISGGSSPLIVIDGVPVFSGDISTNLSANNALGNLNPADIEDVQVLKDAAAAAIYGSRAANGVMLITTKKGKSGKAKVNYDMWV
jgi:TonB-dependent SusC/RagA subfamily outer membrane receptor